MGASVRSFCGAIDPPSPVISVVMPCESLLSERLSIKSEVSDCPSMSINPGATSQARGVNHALGASSLPACPWQRCGRRARPRPRPTTDCPPRPECVHS